MKYSILPTILVLGTLVGCQSEPHPAPGLAALRVLVTADPNKAAAAARPSIYDTSVDADYNKMNRVDIANLHDIVVWVEDGSGKSESPDQIKPLTVNLSGVTPSGLSGAACVGQTVVFHNPTLFPMNVFSWSEGNNFSLGSIAAFQDGSYVVKSAGLIEVKSDPANTPIARIYAAPVGPVFVTQPGSNVDFNNLMPGHYTVVAWQLQVPGSVSEVELAPDKIGHATINVGANLSSKVK